MDKESGEKLVRGGARDGGGDSSPCGLQVGVKEAKGPRQQSRTCIDGMHLFTTLATKWMGVVHVALERFRYPGTAHRDRGPAEPSHL